MPRNKLRPEVRDVPLTQSRHAGYSYCGACGAYAYKQIVPANMWVPYTLKCSWWINFCEFCENKNSDNFIGDWSENGARCTFAIIKTANISWSQLFAKYNPSDNFSAYGTFSLIIVPTVCNAALIVSYVISLQKACVHSWALPSRVPPGLRPLVHLSLRNPSLSSGDWPKWWVHTHTHTHTHTQTHTHTHTHDLQFISRRRHILSLSSKTFNLFPVA